MIRAIRDEEKERYNQVVGHPLQSWEWGDFRKQTGLELERIGFFHGGRLAKALQVTFHTIPILGGTAGYFPRGFMPDEEQLSALTQIAKRHNAVFIKIEPNVAKEVGHASAHRKIVDFLLEHNAQLGRPLFTKYSFVIDLKPSESELFANLSSKTRYNVNLAARKGVEIVERTSSEGLEIYLDILQETTKRQGFYAHSPDYFRKMWQQFADTGIMRIFTADYEDKSLVAWIVFVFNDKIYYPYGASRTIYREVMASNLMMWEMIRLGKQLGCTEFDLWGALGPDPNPHDPWFGFHRFKKGYGGKHLEYLGSFDLVYNPTNYKLFRMAERARWAWLRLRTKLPI